MERIKKGIRFLCISSFQMCASMFTPKKTEETKRQQEDEYNVIKTQGIHSDKDDSKE